MLQDVFKAYGQKANKRKKGGSKVEVRRKEKRKRKK